LATAFAAVPRPACLDEGTAGQSCGASAGGSTCFLRRMPLPRVPASRRGDSGTAREPGPRHSARLTSWSSPPRPIPQSTAHKHYPAPAYRMKQRIERKAREVEAAEEAGRGRRRMPSSFDYHVGERDPELGPAQAPCALLPAKRRVGRPRVVFGQHVQEIMFTRSFFCLHEAVASNNRPDRVPAMQMPLRSSAGDA
jgi:hypothetical protein